MHSALDYEPLIYFEEFIMDIYFEEFSMDIYFEEFSMEIYFEEFSMDIVVSQQTVQTLIMCVTDLWLPCLPMYPCTNLQYMHRAS